MAFSVKLTGKLVTSFHMIKRFAKRTNPGIRHQIKAIEGAAEVIQSDPEGFEGLESDLFSAHKSHREYEVEQMRQREEAKLHLIKHKYFRNDQLPNLLTYAEKDQIRYLHSSDEEEWTVEKLAESFPASAEVVSKILKSRWSALSPKRISLHDASVMKNWERFKNGEYAPIMSKELIEHLNKFAGRDIAKISANLSKMYPKKQWQKPSSNEFFSIISSLRKKNAERNETIKLLNDKNVDMGLKTKSCLQVDIKNRQPITIHELKNRHGINNQTSASYESSSPDHLAKQDENNVNETEIFVKKNNAPISDSNDFSKKFALAEVIINESDKKLYGISETKQRIHIPRKLWRKGATYRVNNCYYHDDGELLYQVPGISLK